jgi:hypothetical protein
MIKPRVTDEDMPSELDVKIYDRMMRRIGPIIARCKATLSSTTRATAESLRTSCSTDRQILRHALNKIDYLNNINTPLSNR